MTETVNTHGTGLVLAQCGILIRGVPGSGKSLLALGLMDWASSRGDKVLLVADDRVDLSGGPKGLTMHAPKAIAGLIELRGRGIVTRPHIESAPVNLVIDLVDELVRMVEEDALFTELLGAKVARAPVPRRGVVDPDHQRLLVAEAIDALSPAGLRQRQKSA